jgi:condensin complex subunit 3
VIASSGTTPSDLALDTITMPAPIAASESSRSAVISSISAALPPHFQQAQHTLANHRKNIVSLHRLHLSCSAVTEQSSKGIRLVGEKAFNDAFLGCFNRVLSLRKGVSNADRIIKFIAAYSAYAQEHFRKAAKLQQQQDDEEDEEDEEEDTPANRFVNILIKHLLRGFGAKDKNVRLRCCQAVALLISGLESIDDDLYNTLKTALLVRASDKEPSVRVQAIIALAKLQGGEDEEIEAGLDPENDERLDVAAILIRLLRHDPSAEVRRAALFNLTLNAESLPYILERLRDVDTINRRCLYLGSLSNAVLGAPDCQVTVGPEEWSTIIKTGLGEREPSVVRATKKLIGSWINIDSGKGETERILSRFNVLDDPEAASMALEAAFEIRPALLDTVAFDDEFWQDLTPEKAFVARTFAKHCKGLGAAGERRMEEAMPLVTALAFRTQAAWGRLVEALESAQESDEGSNLAISANESIVQSLLHVSMNLDYGDEIGRRKMFGLVRELVSHSLFSEHLINDCLDVLRKLSAGQKDFIRIIVEIAQEIEDVIEVDEEQKQDSEDEDEIEGQLLGQTSAADRDAKMSSEERAQQSKIDARRLIIIRGMLERVVGAMHENTAMHGLVSQLIAPAVKSKNAIVREQGLICLGLCCLLDAQLAQHTFGLFLQQMEQAEGPVRLAATRVVFDNLTSHGITFLCRGQIQEAGGDQEAIETVHSQMVNFLLGLLEDDEHDLQSVAAEGMAKLMLSGMVEDDDALRSLVLVYMSPETSGNQQLRQCLSYFLPVYCYSSSACQRRLQRVILPTLDVLTEVYHERDVGQEMVTPLQVGMQLLDWSDSSRALYSAKDVTIHLDVAIEFLQSLFTKEEKEDRKVLCQLLGRLSLPEEDEMQLSTSSAATSDEDFVLLVVLFALLGSLKKAHNNLDKWDATSRNNLNRFQLNCKKRYFTSWDQRIKTIDVKEAAEKELQGVCAFLQECGLDVDTVLDLGNDGKSIAPPTTSSRRTASSSRSATASRNVSASSTVRKASGTSRTTVTVDSDDDDEDTLNPSSMIKEDDEEDDFDTI